MAGGLDNLSAEGFKQLSNTINEAKELIKQQEQLLERTLKLEQQIINKRIAGLREYNDEYFKLLNTIASEQDSLSAAMFKINEEGKRAAANAEKAAEKVKQAQADADKTNNTNNNEPPSKNSKRVNNTISDDQLAELNSDGGGRTSKSIAERIKKAKTLDDQVNATIRKERDAAISIDQLKEARRAKRKADQESYAKAETELENTITSLTMLRLQEKADKEAQLREVQISHIQDMADAELKALQLKTDMQAELAYLNTDSAADERTRYINALDDEKALNELKKQWDAERAELERQAKLKNEGILSKEAAARINKEMAAKMSNEEEIQARLTAIRKKQAKEDSKQREEEAKARKRKTNALVAGAVALNGFSKDNSVKDRIESLRELRNSLVDEGLEKGQANLLVAVKALSNLAQQLDSKIDEIASSKGAVDTRLQGSNNEKWAGSYWDQIVHDMTKVGAVNPYFKQEDFANKIKELVDSGIAFDLEQRAFLATISGKIATTFEVADSTLLRLIRIQQQDSTAGRLGMEAALNAFLNNMYENTEYLKQVADSVRGSLLEMQSLMEGAEAAEVEYQVQKWLGSLYSVGMSQDAVNKISTSLGQIAAGQIEGLTGDGAGNLLIMAANDAGLSIADILTEGLDADNTNKLLQSVVNYLAEIAESTNDNNVVQQQLANVFGMKASDLRAATNLATQDSVSAVYGESMSYDNMLSYLFNMAGSMAQRTSMGEMMTNVWNNVQYSLAGSMASNPLSYLLYKGATLLDNTVGGIAIPAISVMGNMVDLETTVADLMRVGAVGTGLLGSFGSLFQGLGNSFSGQAMLSQLGISSGSGLAVTPRGGAYSSAVGAAGGTVSESGMTSYTGNAAGGDIQNATMQEAADTKEQLMVEAQEEAQATQIDSINTTVLKIYELLDDVAHGSSTLKVKVEGYGLTKAGGGSSLGGVSALNNLSNSFGGGGITGSSSSGLSNTGVNSGGIGGNIDFGGWTTVI